ncbi:MAG: hypothetical protein COU32_03150 [Candidatus Magasanikbacteria bacterium CG10_big_fil_rev_8_21_14_0_10_42_10]|uniref:Uncharacterized protein n=2 Tax=Candidatus Magasanikiibacteriota TaxID=1752731 RepID=A0A2H0TVS0_9BACT|nr:MAG: hypothetical protein COU32_03150 [Candidatus Magasanikbacteria bacterium CG10_big_fil_rev_8_21_14_0_10_42_10]PIZ93205.1 MAG: hypothetical protein COX82_03115 [Candidatus Magasanikbacteria bacterium CG_4_10_14_0_2_um_filter_41_10]
MKRFFNIFFVTLGVIFFLLILAGVYFYIADPFGLKQPFIDYEIKKDATSTPSTVTSAPDQTTTNKNPLLSPTQEKTLEKLGIDPATLPTTITPAMEQCLYSKLGTTRANEIKNGASPTAGDYFAARSCL